jgi:DNA mismatch repair protein MutS2
LKDKPFYYQVEKVKKCYSQYKVIERFIAEDNWDRALKSFTKLSPSYPYEQLTHKFTNRDQLKVADLHHSFLALETYFAIQTHLKNLEIHSRKNVPEHWNMTQRSFRQFIGYKGEVHYDSHPKLYPIFVEKTRLEKSIEKKMDQLLRSDQMAQKLQIDQFDKRYGYYVLPIKAGLYEIKMGPIIDKSESEQTFYVAPKEVVAQCNSIHLLEGELEKLVSQLIAEYLSFLLENQSFIYSAILSLFDFDMIRGKFLYSTNNQFCEPLISEDQHISLDSLYHPLIEKPVTNDLNIKNKRGLAISGPNTGGKSVYLKAVTLSHLFLKMGLYVPASKAKLKFFRHIYFFSDNQQNLSDGLSSFANEASLYLSAARNSKGNDLFVFDELFNSTSSEEGSAISMALIEYLLQLADDNFVFLSTHHNQLKLKLIDDPNFISSHMGFDKSNLAPTYKIHFGSPGPSHAISIFRKFGPLSKKLAQNAEQYLDDRAVNFEKLLGDLDQMKLRLQKQNKKIDQLLLKQKKEVKSIRSLESIKLNEKISVFQDRMEGLLKEAESTLRKSQAIRLAEEFKGREKKIIKEHTKDIKTKEEKKHETSKKPDQILVGRTYFSKFLNKRVQVLNIQSPKKIKVSFGSIKTIVDKEDLFIDRESPKGGPKVKVNISLENTNLEKTHLDCRGLTRDEFEKEIHSRIPYILENKLPFVDIVHGYGVLEKTLLEIVDQYPNLSLDKPQRGNQGLSRLLRK